MNFGYIEPHNEATLEATLKHAKLSSLTAIRDDAPDGTLRIKVLARYTQYLAGFDDGWFYAYEGYKGER